MGQQWHFFYKLKLDFSNPIVNHHFRNKIEPKSTLRQQIIRLRYEINPCEMIESNQDGFGNLVVYGSIVTPHNQFQIVMEGQATTSNQAKEEKADDSESIIFKCPTRFTMPGKRLHDYYKEIHRNGCLEYDKDRPCDVADYYMRQLGRVLQYKKGSSSIDTVAESAMEQGGGVCQDYAHILITLLRMSSIPARYVVGLMCGEGESHAWVEVCQDGYWYGIDPTNQKWVDDSYIKLSSGRDYLDCIMSKGNFEGVVLQTQSVCARVTREEGNETT
ncbi:MAG: transglutaminase family protein [bacterium]|nr:transglutaminase family protein [bacterium]